MDDDTCIYELVDPVYNKWKCLKCGAVEQLNFWNYCPSCGAKIIKTNNPYKYK